MIANGVLGNILRIVRFVLKEMRCRKMKGEGRSANLMIIADRQQEQIDIISQEIQEIMKGCNYEQG